MAHPVRGAKKASLTVRPSAAAVAQRFLIGRSKDARTSILLSLRGCRDSGLFLNRGVLHGQGNAPTAGVHFEDAHTHLLTHFYNLARVPHVTVRKLRDVH